MPFAFMNVPAAGHAMVAMPLTFPHLPKSQTRMPSTGQDCFQPLDPAVVDASIPTFFVGRNRDGLWVARDASGKNGGIFLLKSSALSFARRVSEPAGCATVFPSEHFELDVRNQGNPLIDYLRPLLRLLVSAKSRPGNDGS